MPWLLLILAGVFEVGFTTCLRSMDGLRTIGWNIAFLVCAIASFSLLEQASKIIPLGTAYAVWVGVGAAGTVLVGARIGSEPLGIVRLLLIAGLIGCVVGLKLAR